MAALGKRRSASIAARQGNRKAGLSQGFVRFGTAAHAILLHIHNYGPAGNAELCRVVGSNVSNDLCRMVENGFLWRAGRAREREGVRSFTIFNIEPGRPGSLFTRILTPAERQRAYRERKRLKVSSVFAWKGPAVTRSGAAREWSGILADAAQEKKA
jgi:hypothetical protein